MGREKSEKSGKSEQAPPPEAGYQVLARKWRPQQFDDVIGQAHVTETLKNAVKSNRLAHAYLFVGPRGIGKTSVARIFAKALNCESGPTVTPCGTCASCLEIATGNGLDVLEIDGASNNGVDQVRDLRDTVKFMPSRGRFKIYIIDEVHMLSVAAFNALLKTLEEPPAHVKFLFATTEADKILPTIVSRCQRFDLRRIPVPLIIQCLRDIAAAEKVTIDEDALLAIARGSEGGLRDAESALDQLVSFKGRQITEEDVLSVFGLVSRALLDQLAEAVLTGDVQQIVRTIAKLDAGGKDLQRLVVELMEHFRNLLICLNVPDLSDGFELSPPQIETLKRQAALTQTDRVLRVVKVLGEAYDSMKYALSRRTLLETALIRGARAAVVVSLEEILARINELRRSGPGADGGPGGSGPGPTQPEMPLAGASSAAARVPSAPASRAPAPVVPPAHRATPPTGAAAGGDFAAQLSRLVEHWQEVGQQAGKIAVLASGALRDARPVAVHEDRVVVAFDPEFADEARSFDVPRNRKAIEHAIGEFLRRKVTVECVVRESAAAEDAPAGRDSEAAPPGVGEPVPAEQAEPSAPGGDHRQKSRQEWLQVPEVQKVLEAFNGVIVDVRA